jgi:hypothetical protein
MAPNGYFLVQQSRFCGWAATQAQLQHSNGPTKGALRHDDGVADANRMVGFSYN